MQLLTHFRAFPQSLHQMLIYETRKAIALSWPVGLVAANLEDDSLHLQSLKAL